VVVVNACCGNSKTDRDPLYVIQGTCIRYGWSGVNSIQTTITTVVRLLPGIGDRMIKRNVFISTGTLYHYIKCVNIYFLISFSSICTT
jgi:hypothetical protein